MTARRRSLAAVIVISLLGPALPAQDVSLFSQSASAELTRQFGDGNLSWLLLDRSGGVLAQHWDDPNAPIPLGSLLKPFIAVAYGEQHKFVYPHVLCTGTRSRCWLPQGHGRIGLEAAISGSCNTYFLSLADFLDRQHAQSSFARFGLIGPPPNADANTLVGLTDEWREPPIAIARAYLALAIDTGDPAQEPILAGMRSAAASGTARAVDLALGPHAALAKTGTAPCSHHPRAAADGFALVLFPASQPRLLLLVRMHGATGAHTAIQAGAMLRALGIGEL